MAGTRLPVEEVQRRGKKHLTKAEIAQRQAQEVRLDKPKKIKPPVWLPGDLVGEFKALAKELLESDMGAAGLDRDTIGRYLVAQAQYAAATRMVRDALDRESGEEVSLWTQAQGEYFKQARACANDMGLTITSRCRLVVPERSAQSGEDANPFLQLVQRRREA